MKRKIEGLMTNSGFLKLQMNTVSLYLAKCRNDQDDIKVLTEARKAICDDDSNYVYEEVAE